MIINIDSLINEDMNPVVGIWIWCSIDLAVDSALDSCQPLTVCVCVCVVADDVTGRTRDVVCWLCCSKNKITVTWYRHVHGFILILILILMLFWLHVVVVDD
eukprot:TRINITY_DN7615_c0_g1_i6.p1 TRINITY_DN7615_c0_g1~~TRINITY_DN7615_c0_g1_i6.p1  ORF type:complete len:102 (+),score=11.41 TRINITY_DN7615_c0_g1_i6:189-494(+)